MGKLDLRDVYYLVPVERDYRKYLRFSVDGVLYEFNYKIYEASSMSFT